MNSDKPLSPVTTPVPITTQELVPNEFDGAAIDRQSTGRSSIKFKESDAGDGTKRQDQYLHGARLGLCFLSLFLCLFLFALDQTIVVTILTTVGNKFDAFSKVGWLSSGFLLTMAVFIQPFGKLSIIFGRKWTMVAAVVIFESGSLMCALSNNMNVLIGGRVLAGVGGAGIQGISFVIISEIVPINKRPIGMAIMSVVFAVASVLGPLIGGAFTSHVSWRWAFYINLPVGGIALVTFCLVFRPPLPKVSYIQELKLFDYLGTFLLISGFVVLLLALTFGGSEFSWDSGPVIACFIIGPLLLIAFCVWNFKFSKNQVIATEIVKIPQIVASVVAISGVFGAFIGVMIYCSIYFQVIKDNSAMGAGLHLLPCIISVVISSIFAGVMIQKFRYVKPFNIASGIIAPIGAGILTLLEVDSSFSTQVGLLIPLGAACGLQMQPSFMSAQIKAPKTPGGMIMTTIFLNFSRSIVAALAADLADAVFTTSLTNIFSSAVKSPTLDPEILSELQGVDLSGLMANNEVLKQLSPAAEFFVKTQMMKAIRNVFYMSLGFTIISFVAVFFVTNKKLPKAVDMGEKKKEVTKDEENQIEESIAESSRIAADEEQSEDTEEINSIEKTKTTERQTSL